jgi:hypothetical protein
MRTEILRAAGAALALAGALAPQMKAELAYAVDSKAILISFDTDAPFFVYSQRLIRGLQPGEGILGIDFRPANKRLYGLGSTSRLYTIDIETGVATAVGAAPFSPALDGAEFGFDFNPTVDRIRVVSDKGQNLRLHPDTGAVAATDTNLNYSDAGLAPGVVASAYTNSVAGATSTLLYGIDAKRGVLVTQNPPNDGRLNDVGGIPDVDFSSLAGFDISPNSNTGFAVVRHSKTNACEVYQIDLPSGAQASFGAIYFFEQISGFAIAPR